jgi:hypothetical protein
MGWNDDEECYGGLFMAGVVIVGPGGYGLTGIQGRHILALARWDAAEGSFARHMGNPG